MHLFVLAAIAALLQLQIPQPQGFVNDFAGVIPADRKPVLEQIAREDPVPGVTGALVADAIPLAPDRVVFEPSWSAVAGLAAGGLNRHGQLARLAARRELGEELGGLALAVAGQSLGFAGKRIPGQRPSD